MSGKLSRQVFNLNYLCPVLGSKLHLYETIILHKMTYWFGNDSSCGNFIVDMCPSLPRLALICQLPLSTLKKYLTRLRKRNLLVVTGKTIKDNNIYCVSLETIKPFLMTEQQQIEVLSSQKNKKIESENRRIQSKKDIHQACQVDNYDQLDSFRGHSIAPENMQKENFQGPQEKLSGATRETFRGHTVAPTNDLLIYKINKLNIDLNSEITPEPEDIYLFSYDNNISEEDVIIEDQTNIEHHVSCKTEEAKQNGIIVIEQLTSHASNMANLSPKMQIIISKIQDMRRSGIIPANIAGKTDQTLSAEAAVHVKDQIAKGFTFEQGLKSFENLVKKDLFKTPNSMQKHINQHERIKTEKENLQKSLITDERTLKISSEKKSQEEIVSCKNAAKNAFDLMSKCLPGLKSKTNNVDGLKLVVSNAKNDAKVNPELINKTFAKPRTNRLIDSSGDEEAKRKTEEQMKEFARMNPGLLAL